MCPAWALTCCLKSNDRRGWTQPKWNRKAATVRNRLKEAESEVLTVGARTGDEAGGGRQASEDSAKPEFHTKTPSVEPGGMERRSMFLPGEIWSMRVGQKSAEAVVVMRLVERPEERRAEV